MQSNKLILQVDRKTMGGAYLQGITEINANSLLVNELVVKIGSWTGQTDNFNLYDTETQKFTQGKLLAGETLWVDFAKRGTNITKSMLLIEREETLLSSTEEVDGVTITEVPAEKRYEYYLTLPQAIMQNAGVWDFSLSIKHVSAINVANINQLQYMGEWNAGTGAVQTVRTAEIGDFYHCTGVGYYNPDGTRNATQYQLGEHAVYNGTSWVGSTNLFEFDYIKSSSLNTPYNLTVNNSLTMAGSNKPITEADVAAFLEMLKFDIPICCVTSAVLNKNPNEYVNSGLSLVKAGVPVEGQYVLFTNGIGLIEEIKETTMSVKVLNAYKVRLNGENVTADTSFFAPTNSGTNGQVLAANSNGIPVWRNLKINNSALTSNKSIYAPIEAGEAGQVLVSQGSGKEPTWGDAPTGGGGGGGSADVGEIQICCVATQHVLGVGEGVINFATIEAGNPVVGKYALCSNGVGLITELKSTYAKIYVKTSHLTRLNGELASYISFFAPISAGVSGYFLVSTGDGAPVWKDPSSLTAFGANMCMVLYENGDTGDFGVATFTIFGNYTGGEVYSIEQMYNIIYNSVGENHTVLANGMWNEMPVLAVMVADGYFVVMTMDMEQHTIEVLGEEGSYAHAMLEATSMSKTFNDSNNWNNEGGDVWE